MEAVRQFRKTIFKENALFVLVLGLCASLATTTSVKNGFFMALATLCVIVSANTIVSLIRRRIPNGVRIPCFIIVIASFVMIVDMLMNAFAPPAVVAALGIFIPLIVVNCVPLARAEAYAAKQNVINSVGDGMGIGVGYMLALVLISAIREFLGNGSFWEIPITAAIGPGDKALIKTPSAMVIGPGAFITLGCLFAFFKWRRERKTHARAVLLTETAVPWEIGPEKKREAAPDGA
jgi:electron transport complex protein RnfE